jgi:hypothetical protein
MNIIKIIQIIQLHDKILTTRLGHTWTAIEKTSAASELSTR